MNKNIGIVIGLFGLVLILGVLYGITNTENDATVNNNGNESSSTSTEEDVMMKTDDQMEEVGMMEKKEASAMDEEMKSGGNDAMMKTGSYEAYAPSKLARAETGDVVLFFHASWCPSCRALNADIEKNAGTIPEGVTILKTDYDKETALKKKYGVTYQHTLVQVDSNGNLIKKWSGSPTLAHMVSEIQ